MSKEKAARLGDTASGHGCFPPTNITSGSPNVSINGKPAARVGDSLAAHGCSDCPTHGRVIAQGSSTVFINGKPAARTGDAISCGGNVIVGSGNVFIGGGTTNYSIDESGSYTPIDSPTEIKPSYSQSVDSQNISPIDYHGNSGGYTNKTIPPIDYEKRYEDSGHEYQDYVDTEDSNLIINDLAHNLKINGWDGKSNIYFSAMRDLLGFSVLDRNFYFGSFVNFFDGGFLQHEQMFGFENNNFVNWGYTHKGIYSEISTDSDLLAQYDFEVGLRGKVIHGNLSEKINNLRVTGDWGREKYDFINNNCQLFVSKIYGRK